MGAGAGHLVAALAPQSLAAEQYRSLRTRIKRAENGRAVRAIRRCGIGSPARGRLPAGCSVTSLREMITMSELAVEA